MIRDSSDNRYDIQAKSSVFGDRQATSGSDSLSGMMAGNKKSPLSQWVIDAIAFAKISQAGLGRLMANEIDDDGWASDRSRVNKIVKSGRGLSADELFAIARITKFPIPHDLLPKNSRSGSNASHNPKSHRAAEETIASGPDYRLAPTPDIRRAAVPIRGRAMAGKEGVLQFSDDDIVGYADSVEKLARVPDAYAVYVTGNSMEPVMYAGYICRIDPNVPAAKGDNVVVQVSEDHGVTVLGYIKRLISMDDKTVKACQFNPKREITWPRKHVISVHPIVSWGPPY